MNNRKMIFLLEELRDVLESAKGVGDLRKVEGLLTKYVREMDNPLDGMQGVVDALDKISDPTAVTMPAINRVEKAANSYHKEISKTYFGSFKPAKEMIQDTGPQFGVKFVTRRRKAPPVEKPVMKRAKRVAVKPGDPKDLESAVKQAKSKAVAVIRHILPETMESTAGALKDLRIALKAEEGELISQWLGEAKERVIDPNSEYWMSHGMVLKRVEFAWDYAIGEYELTHLESSMVDFADLLEEFEFEGEYV